MDDSLMNLFKMGEITKDDTLRYSVDQKSIKEQLGKL